MDAAALLLAIVIRVYDSGFLPDQDRAMAIATASAILQVSEIGSSWRTCQPSRPHQRVVTGLPERATGLTCSQPMGPGEVSVRLVRGETPVDARGRLPLGYSLVDTAIGKGVLATIYLDRVDWLAAAAGVDARVLLGRAIAHEIGHLMLGTNAHSREGLMRPTWSRAELQRDRPGDWSLTSREAVAIRRSLATLQPTLRADNIVRGRDRLTR